MNRTILAVLSAVLVLAGCSSAQGDGIASAGGTQSAAQSAAPADDEEMAREFVDCMRENGIDLPDPVPDGNGGFKYGIKEAGVDLGDPQFRDALKACQEKLPGGVRGKMDDPEMQDALRAFAQCMRDHGVDFPDPDPNGGFGGAFGEVDRDSPQVQQAIEACQDKLPQRGGR